MQTAYRLNDNKIRAVLIPAFGIIIPHLTGLYGWIENFGIIYWIGFFYFILISLVIYQGNRWLLFKQREHYDWFNNPLRKVIMLVFANVFYTAPVTFLMIWGWFAFTNEPIDWDIMRAVLLMNVIAVIFVTHVYETVFLIKERESDRLRIANTERAKAESELQALKNQIDPHFMFNSLNTLSHLIENDREKALAFNENLSDVYRYILMNKDAELIQLKEELDFFNSYYALLKLRFGDSIKIKMENISGTNGYFIPPISMQVLLENAVKHNSFSDADPLVINLIKNDDSIFISNKIKYKQARVSSGIGLKNLNERYKLTTGKEISVSDTNNIFGVKLPLVETTI